jgi:hypothetical protein
MTRIGAFGGTSLASGADALLGLQQRPSRALSLQSRQFRNASRYPADFPATLFAENEQGVWYDPSDLSTLFQDELGSVPVTGVEQPVRRILDKSGNGNHAIAIADARRPVLSARVNLLDATETLATQSVTVLAVSHTLSFTGDGTVTLSGASTAGPLVGTGATDRVSLAFTPTAGSLTLTVTGTVTDADLRVTNDGVGLPAYQRVTTSTDYDTTDFPRFLRFDGVDDAMVTQTINWSASDKASACVGIRSIGAGTYDVFSMPPTFGYFRMVWLGNNLNFIYLAGDNGVQRGASVAPPRPVTTVVIGTADIAKPQVLVRTKDANNGTLQSTTLTASGTGRFSRLSLTLGAIGNSSFLSGRVYQMVLRGALTSPAQEAELEAFVNAKTRAF